MILSKFSSQSPALYFTARSGSTFATEPNPVLTDQTSSGSWGPKMFLSLPALIVYRRGWVELLTNSANWSLICHTWPLAARLFAASPIREYSRWQMQIQSDTGMYLSDFLEFHLGTWSPSPYNTNPWWARWSSFFREKHFTIENLISDSITFVTLLHVEESQAPHCLYLDPITCMVDDIISECQ